MTGSMMKILIISHKFDPHVDHMLAILRSLRIGCVRWIVSSFPTGSTVSLEIDQDGCRGHVDAGAWQSELQEVRSVWYRHPAPPELPRGLESEDRAFAEREVRAALRSLYGVGDWFWVNHPERVRAASSKPLQLKVAAELGLRIPKTLVSNDPARIRRFCADLRDGVIYKPFHSGFIGSRGKFCCTRPLNAEDIANLDLIAHTSGIFQERVAKAVEIRITVIGRTVFAAEIHSQGREDSEHDWRQADIDDLPHAPHKLPRDIEECCLRFLDRYGLAFGAFDMILTPANEYVFLENNPMGQFGWIEDKIGEPLTATLARMLVTGHIV